MNVDTLMSEVFPLGFGGLEEVLADLNSLIEAVIFVLIIFLLAQFVNHVKDVFVF